MKMLRIAPLILIALNSCTIKLSNGRYDGYESTKPLTTSAPEELLGLTNDDLVNLSLGSPKGPEDCAPLYEYRITNIARSALDANDAVVAAKERFTNRGEFSFGYNVATDASVTLDSEFFYVVNVSWDHFTDEKKFTYNGDAFCFKDEFVHLTIDESYHSSMAIKDFSAMKTLLDLYEFQHNTTHGGWRLICSEIEEKEDEYLYSNYTVQTCYGDWGLRDRIDLVKGTYSISKEGGTVAYLGETVLQTAYGKMN